MLYFQDKFMLEFSLCVEEDGLTFEGLSLLFSKLIGDVSSVRGHPSEVAIGHRVAHSTL
jgi:hypothetical protein